jgi:hypothetical protein
MVRKEEAGHDSFIATLLSNQGALAEMKLFRVVSIEQSASFWQSKYIKICTFHDKGPSEPALVRIRVTLFLRESTF